MPYRGPIPTTNPFIPDVEKYEYTEKTKLAIKIFEKKQYPLTSSFQDDINDFLQYLSEKGISGNINFFESIVYVVYENNR